MTFKTMAELNAADSHLRDLELTVDGLNVVDIQFAGPGVWAPRFTVQISGDQGYDEKTNQRRVYLAAAEYLSNVLGLNDGTRAHAFVPHANISRDDLEGDFAEAVATAESAIAGLRKAWSEPVINPEGEGVIEAFEWYGKSLHIVARIVDFDLIEKRILPAAAFDKLQGAINTPADPSSELVKLMQGERRFTTRVENGGEPLDEQEGDFTTTNVSKYFDGVLHTSVLLEGGFCTPSQVFWIPADREDEFPSLDAMRTGTTLQCVAASDAYVEYLVQLPEGSTAAEVELDVRNVTKIIDGVNHTRQAFTLDDNTVWVYWVPEDYPIKMTHCNDLPEDSVVRQMPREGNEFHWQVLNKKYSYTPGTKVFNGVEYTSRVVSAGDDVVNLWVPAGVIIDVEHLEDIPLDKRVLVLPESDELVAQWRLL